MSKVSVFMAEGMEEVECLSIADILRRGNVTVQTVSTTGSLSVTGAHAITVMADVLFEKADFSDSDILFLPGGIPGVPNLAAHAELTKLLIQWNKQGKKIAAICAAPGLLGQLNILQGKKATCDPGWKNQLTGASYTSTGVVTDKNITTGRGLGFAIDLGLELLRLLKGAATAQRIKESIQHP